MTRSATKFCDGRAVCAALAVATLLVAGCGGGGGGGSGDSGGDGNSSPLPAGTVSGRVNYEFVPPASSCRGLDFSATEVRPIRGATVQLIDAPTGNVLDSVVSSDSGDYSFSGVELNTMVRLRVRAQLKKTAGRSCWDVEVRDNVDTSANPPPLSSRPVYVIESSEFDTGTSNVERNLTAATGWTGSAYGEPRSAAPFAILDAIYTAIRFVEAADPDAFFPPLDAFWSVNNTATASDDIDQGLLGVSFYDDRNRLFLVGDATDDTDEFDDHIIVHEWGHYFEDNFSRSDSFGGPHSLGERLDARLAFGEGWAHAIAAMALDDPRYCDTGVPGTSGGFGFDAESGIFGGQGWYDEISVLRFIYDLWDIPSEGTDTGSIGFDPIYAIMIGPQASTEAFTTVFSFAAELRAVLDQTGQDLLDAQLGDEQIDATVLNIWGDQEPNAAGAPLDVLPIYTDMVADGSVINICANSQFDSGRDGNKLSEYRYLRIDLPLDSRYDFNITTTTLLPDDPADPDDQSDPDVFLFLDGALVEIGGSGAENAELFTTQTLPGPDTYTAALREFRFMDENTPATFPERVCFDVSMTPVP